MLLRCRKSTQLGREAGPCVTRQAGRQPCESGQTTRTVQFLVLVMYNRLMSWIDDSRISREALSRLSTVLPLAQRRNV